MKKLLSILIVAIAIVLSGCRVPTVPEDCVGSECEVDFCELNPEDITCEDTEDPDLISIDEIFTGAVDSISGNTSYTESATYTYAKDDVSYENSLITEYEKDVNSERVSLHSSVENDFGTYQQYYMINKKKSSIDLYQSNNGESYYANSDMSTEGIDDAVYPVEFGKYTYQEKTISTRDYYVFTTSFNDLDSLRYFVEGYYPFNFFRELPLSLFNNQVGDLEVMIYVDKDSKELKIVDIEFSDIINNFFDKVGETHLDSLHFRAEFSDIGTTNVELPTEFEEASFPIEIGLYYDNLNSTFDMYSIDYSIDQVLENPLADELLILDQKNFSIHFLNYETLEDNVYSFDYKPMTMFIKDDYLYVGLQVRPTLSDDVETMNGRIEVYDLNTMDLVSSFDVKYDPYDILVTDYGQIVVSPATGQLSAMMIYDMNGNLIDETFISESMYIYLDNANNRIYQYAYWDGVRKVVELSEDGMVVSSYRPDHDITADSHEPKELFMAPDDSLIITGRGSLHLAINDREYDGLLLTRIPFKPNHVTFTDTEFYISDAKGIIQSDYELSGFTLISSPLESTYNTLTKTGLLSINKTSTGQFYLTKHTIDDACSVDSTESSCNDNEIKELTYNPETLSDKELQVLEKVDTELVKYSSVTILTSIREIDDNVYHLVYETDGSGEELIILVVLDENFNIETLDSAVVNPNPDITGEELKTMMADIISKDDICDYFVGEAYYTCMTTDIVPYKLYANWWHDIDGNYISYSATKDGTDYLEVLYTGHLVRENGALRFKNVQVTDLSFPYGMEQLIRQELGAVFNQIENSVSATDICTNAFVNADQASQCIDLANLYSGLDVTTTFIRDYDNTGRDAYRVEFEYGYTYIFYVDGIMGENYDILIDWELIEFIDPSTMVTPDMVENLMRQFYSGYYQPSLTDYCERYISDSNQALKDACYAKDVKTFRSASMFMDIYNVIDLGDHTFELYARHSEYKDYYEVATIHMVFEDHQWKFDTYTWEPVMSITVQEASDIIEDTFLDVETYNDHDYCIKTLGVSYNDIPDSCRIDLLDERLAGTRYTLTSITHKENSTFTVEYLKETPMQTFEIVSDMQFYQFNPYGQVSFIETILSETEITSINGSLLSQIKAKYDAYLLDLLDPTITDQDIYDTYINTHYDFTAFASSRTLTLTDYQSISIVSVDYVVDYRYQVYYEITFETTNTNNTVETYTQKVKVDTNDPLKIGPLFGGDYTISLQEASIFMEDVIDAAIIMYFAQFSCSDFVSSSIIDTCSNTDQATFLQAQDWPRDVLVEDLGNNQFTVSYIIDYQGTVGTTITVELVLEDGTIKIESIS